MTDLAEPILVDYGSRFRAVDLTTQCGVTLNVAKSDGPALTDLLPDGFLGAAAALSAEVTEAAKDVTNATAEARDATGTKTDAIRGAKVWRRKVVKRAQRAARAGAKLPPELPGITQASSAAAVEEQVTAMVPRVEKNLPALAKAGKGADALLAAGKEILSTLGAAVIGKETSHLDALPKAVRAFYAKKGELYVALEQVNDAGHELHAGDIAEGGRYNLRILYRRGRGTADTSEPSSPPAPPSTP